MVDGTVLKRIRIIKNKTRKYVAECCGVSERWIESVENSGSNPSEELYTKWINCLYDRVPKKKNSKEE